MANSDRTLSPIDQSIHRIWRRLRSQYSTDILDSLCLLPDRLRRDSDFLRVLRYLLVRLDPTKTANCTRTRTRTRTCTRTRTPSGARTRVRTHSVGLLGQLQTTLAPNGDGHSLVRQAVRYLFSARPRELYDTPDRQTAEVGDIQRTFLDLVHASSQCYIRRYGPRPTTDQCRRWNTYERHQVLCNLQSARIASIQELLDWVILTRLPLLLYRGGMPLAIQIQDYTSTHTEVRMKYLVTQTQEMLFVDLRDRPSLPTVDEIGCTRMNQIEFAGVLLAQVRHQFAHLPSDLLGIVNAYTNGATV